MFAPRPVSSELKEVSLTGMLFPWDCGQPVLLRMPLSEAFYLPLFDDETKLRDLMAQAKTSFSSIKQVEEGFDFLESLPRILDGQELKIILNPRFTETGTVRFTELKFT